MKKSLVLLVLLLIGSGCTKDVPVSDSLPDSLTDIVEDSVPEYIPDSVDVEGPTVLVNGGLEEWENGLPKGWTGAELYEDNSIFCQGEKSVMLQSPGTGTTAKLYQVVPVTGGSRIKFSFKYYIQEWGGSGAKIYCYLRKTTAESSNLTLEKLREFYTEEQIKSFRNSALPHNNLRVWQTYSVTIPVIPEAKYFVLGVHSYAGTTINIDDAYLGKITRVAVDDLPDTSSTGMDTLVVVEY